MAAIPIVTVGDIHSGSIVGLCPPDYVTQDGSSYGLNKTQEWLWACWGHFNNQWLPRVLKGRAYDLVLVGDLTEGIHHSNGREVIHADPAVHAKIAVECLRPLAAKARKVYVVRGTDCHVGSAEAAIGERLDAQVDPETGERSAFHWLLKRNGVLLSFMHHIATTGRIALEGSGLSIALAEVQAQCARVGHPVPRVVHRAHRHVYGHFSDGDAMITVGAPFQTKTPHAYKAVPNSRTRIGAGLYDFEGAEEGELPTYRPCLYTAKPRKPEGP